MKSFILFILSMTLLSSCNNSSFEKNMAELDKIHGKCDNPYRQYGPIEYKICKDKERAAGPDGIVGDPISLEGILSNIRTGNSSIIASDTNNHLWDASLQLVSPYALNISDFEGGYIETKWILNKSMPNSRCLIKIHITSMELISNGVKTNIVCEEKIEQTWYRSDDNYQNEEKNLTLKILTEAARISSLS